MGWKMLATAPDQLIAEMWMQILVQEGIPAMIDPADAVSFLGLSGMPCRVLVEEGRVQEASAVLSEHLGQAPSP